MRVLVVDDERSVVDTVCLLLEELGHEAVGVTHGAAALEAFRRSGFDIVIVDLMMAAMNGLEVIRRLRVIDHEARIVALTGASFDVEDVLAAAGVPLVRKPIATTADVAGLIEAA
jgi:hypothetical protein